VSSGKEPSEKVHRGDCHTDTEEDSGEDTLGPTLAERKGEARNDDGNE
jgi:hypothetical protein